MAVSRTTGGGGGEGRGNGKTNEPSSHQGVWDVAHLLHGRVGEEGGRSASAMDISGRGGEGGGWGLDLFFLAYNLSVGRLLSV